MPRSLPAKRKRVCDGRAAEEFSSPPRQKRNGTHLEPRTKSSVVAQLHFAGIDHNVSFQSAHERAKIHMEKGHWAKFTQAIVAGTPLACPVCADLRMKFEEASKSEREAVCKVARPKHIAKPTSIPPLRSKGRPSKQEGKDFDLTLYIREHRAKVFTPIENNETLPGYPWWCVPCQKTVHFHVRGSVLYVDLHEGRDCHLRACAKLGISVNGAREISNACNGVKLTDSTPWLGSIHASFGNWHAAGMPWACTERMKSVLGFSDGEKLFPKLFVVYCCDSSQTFSSPFDRISRTVFQYLPTT